jgi:hypothetical protein
VHHAQDGLLDGGILVEGLAPFGQLTAERGQGWMALVPHLLTTLSAYFQLHGE